MRHRYSLERYGALKKTFCWAMTEIAVQALARYFKYMRSIFSHYTRATDQVQPYRTTHC